MLPCYRTVIQALSIFPYIFELSLYYVMYGKIDILIFRYKYNSVKDFVRKSQIEYFWTPPPPPRHQLFYTLTEAVILELIHANGTCPSTCPKPYFFHASLQNTKKKMTENSGKTSGIRMVPRQYYHIPYFGSA